MNAPNPDKKLMPGMTASATIFIEEKQNTLILSGKAMRFTPDAAYLKSMMAGGGQGMPSAGSFPGLPEGMKTVWVKDEKIKIKPVPVNVGIENGSHVEILSGLKEGDEVIISMSGTAKKESTRQGGPGGPMPF
jgi:HlyD family secretion protein